MVAIHLTPATGNPGFQTGWRTAAAGAVGTGKVNETAEQLQRGNRALCPMRSSFRPNPRRECEGGLQGSVIPHCYSG